MDVEKIFQKIENKLLKKDNLTGNEKKLLERVKNKDIDLIIELLIEKLQKIKDEIDKLKMFWNKLWFISLKNKAYLKDKIMF